MVFALAVLLCLSLLAGRPTPVSGDLQTAPEAHAAFVPGEILVAFRTGPAPLGATTTDNLLQAHQAVRSGRIVSASEDEYVDVVRVPEGSELTVIEALNRDPGVRYAEPNYVVRAFATPNDPYLAQQWAYTTIRARSAWDIVTGTTSITIAVVDTGIDPTHPDLAGKIVPGYDYVQNDNDPRDGNGHGTHVAGIAAAVTNNAIGVAGMSWGARIMPLRVLDEMGNGDTAKVASAIGWAHLNGAKIINLSLGGDQSSQTLQEAITRAHNAGILVVAAMGNSGSSTPNYPAAFSNVMAVGATDINDTRAWYSNYGNHIDISAPGGVMACHGITGIYSTMPTYDVYLTLPNPSGCTYYRGYDTMQGTSQATPFVAGLAALMWSQDPTLTPTEVQQIIQSTAVDLGAPGWDQLYGWGRIDALAAVETLLTLEPPLLDPIAAPDATGAFWVTWSEVPHATRYILEEDVTSSFSSAVVRYSGENTAVQVTGRLPGTYTYRVRAERPSAEKVSEWSATRSITLGLGAPILEAIENHGDPTYQVAWQGVIGATGYQLQESTTPDFAGPLTEDMGSALSYSTSKALGSTWHYRVRAYNTWEFSDWSATRTVTVRPAQPTLDPIARAGAPDAYRISWSSPAGATGYRLQESPDAAFSSAETRYLGANTVYTVTGQPAGLWTYRVEAFNAGGTSTPSITRSITVTAPSIPAPTLLAIDNDDGDAEYVVQWTSVATATGYLLEESASPYFEAPLLIGGTPLTPTSHTVFDQQPGTWHYRVRAVTSAGAGPWSGTEAVLVPGYAFLPLIMRASP